MRARKNSIKITNLIIPPKNIQKISNVAGRIWTYDRHLLYICFLIQIT